ncbi:hypothetical protein PanWU01x14_250670 [Parasponia andersonii]|uniref:Transmembrane protein n=1 Tax=Parasponia andersonii TaxID=3476 RepID=A0A2P5BCL9_PARAD|nr:hypothetical protein PanWU01x14_250670 [Parasponia andersonii]
MWPLLERSTATINSDFVSSSSSSTTALALIAGTVVAVVVLVLLLFFAAVVAPNDVVPKLIVINERDESLMMFATKIMDFSQRDFFLLWTFADLCVMVAS